MFSEKPKDVCKINTTVLSMTWGVSGIIPWLRAGGVFRATTSVKPRDTTWGMAARNNPVRYAFDVESTFSFVHLESFTAASLFFVWPLSDHSLKSWSLSKCLLWQPKDPTEPKLETWITYTGLKTIDLFKRVTSSYLPMGPWCWWWVASRGET